MLEYHLATITNRSQELAFQRFAHRLAQRQICPNLLPQTGPTGGGDSQVDAETYPVADDLTLVWYVGTGREAGNERWAFAFSAKKKWRDKVQSDVAKIAATGRGYTKAFFITNQYVPDRSRAQVEDTLREKHGIDVRILDCSWILDRVFEGKHEALAIEELGLAVSVRTHVRRGPLDLCREEELTKVQAGIDQATQQGQCGHRFVDDCIEAAILARGLELARTEVEGLFLRARRVADKHGSPHQRLVCAYQAAWTAYWWHEDHQLFAELYGSAEAHAAGTPNAYHLELMTNLWMVLHFLVESGQLSRADARLENRTDSLTAELERLSRQEHRPSTALQARTHRLMMQLISTFPGNEDAILHELQDVVRKCERLVGYPLEPFVEVLVQLGEILGDRPAYGELFDTIVQTASARKEEVSAARMLLRRGAQQLDAETPYEAIRSLGKALVRLYKHESREDLARARMA